jgi:hypothetical protein
MAKGPANKLNATILMAIFGSFVGTGAPIADDRNFDDPKTISEVRPSLADLMSIAQLRHFKVGYAHRVNNWKLAGYELDKLEETFTRIARLYPSAAKVAQSGLIDEKTKPALSELRRAIAEQNTPLFKSAYITVTKACNECHAAANVGFIAIRVPTKSPFSNQVFDPQR